MAIKDWKNQTTKYQKRIGTIKFIHIKKGTQIGISRWDFDKAPRNWQFNVNSVSEARKGYPSQRLGITKSKAIRRLNSYMRTH